VPALWVHPRDHLAPELRGVQNISLIHRSYFAASLTRCFESDARNPLDFRCRVDFRVEAALRTVRQFGYTLRLAEVDASRELANCQKIRPFDNLSFYCCFLSHC